HASTVPSRRPTPAAARSSPRSLCLRRCAPRRVEGGRVEVSAMTTTAERVDRAFQRVPRADFLPEAVRAWAGGDSPLQLTDGQTSSQPSTVRAMLMLLDVRSGHRVLDVGSGSGWTTALLAALAGPAGSVDGVEVRPDLADWGAANLTARAWGQARIPRAGRA